MQCSARIAESVPWEQVNKIREVPQHPHILVTHTDAKELYVWNVLTQPNRAFDKVSHSAPALKPENWLLLSV